MNRNMIVVALLLAGGTLTGCALFTKPANVTETTIERSKTDGVKIRSGKDVKFEEMSWRETVGSNVVVDVKVKGYDSRTNVEAIKAQGQREADTINATVGAVKAGADLAGELAGKAAKGAGS